MQGHGQFMVESSDKMWSTREGNGNPLQYSCLENSMDRSSGRLQFMGLEKKCKKAKWLSGEALQVAVKRREAKRKDISN